MRKLNVSDLGPRELLTLWAHMARIANTVNASRPPRAAHGERALRRRARRRRGQVKLMRERRSTLRSLTVKEQKAAS